MDFSDDRVALHLTNGTELHFDTVYPALGSDSNNALARQLGIDLSDDRCIVVDTKQRASVAGVYAAGDVVLSLDKTRFAMGPAAIPATPLQNHSAHQAGGGPG